jgi:AcrR family transcriptional regulator
VSDSIHLRLEEMQKRVAQDQVSGSAGDRGLTEKRQQQIVEGAGSVLFEKGFHRTSIRDIATTCGMSMGQLYHYISSKDDILYLIHKHSQAVWYQHLVDAGFEQVADPEERLAYALRGSISFVYANKDLFQFLYSESRHLDREHLKLVLDIDDKNVVGFYRLLLSEIPSLSLGDDGKEVAANLIAFIVVFLALRGWNLDSTKVSEEVDFLVEFTFRGLGLTLPNPLSAAATLGG